MRSQKGFGFLETILAIGVLSTLFLSGIFLAKESLGLRKLEDVREDLSLLTKSFYAYGSIPTNATQFNQFLNATLNTSLDSFSRQYRLILANSVNNNAVASVCGAQNTDLTVRLPNGTVLNNVVAVILSAGEDGAYDTFTQNGLSNQTVVRVARNAQNPLLLHAADMFTVMTLTEFKAKNCALPAEDVSSTYGRLFVGYSRPSNPGEGDMFYHLGNGTLEKYTNGTWVNVNWQAIVRASPEYNAGRLRIQNNILEISPDGTNWYGVIPAVGANTIEIVDANNYIYWMPPGTTAIIMNSHRLPIAYTPAVEPSFRVSYWNNVNYVEYFGLRPSGVAIMDGFGTRDRTPLTIVPVAYDIGALGENWASFTLNIRSNQRWLVTGTIGEFEPSFTYLEHLISYSSAGVGTAPPDSYWLGLWWSEYYVTRITMNRVVITRH